MQHIYKRFRRILSLKQIEVLFISSSVIMLSLSLSLSLCLLMSRGTCGNYFNAIANFASVKFILISVNTVWNWSSDLILICLFLSSCHHPLPPSYLSTTTTRVGCCPGRCSSPGSLISVNTVWNWSSNLISICLFFSPSYLSTTTTTTRVGCSPGRCYSFGSLISVNTVWNWSSYLILICQFSSSCHQPFPRRIFSPPSGSDAVLEDVLLLDPESVLILCEIEALISYLFVCSFPHAILSSPFPSTTRVGCCPGRCSSSGSWSASTRAGSSCMAPSGCSKESSSTSSPSRSPPSSSPSCSWWPWPSARGSGRWSSRSLWASSSTSLPCSSLPDTLVSLFSDDHSSSIDILTAAMRGMAVSIGSSGCNVPESQYRNSFVSNIKAVHISFIYRIHKQIYKEFLPFPFLE